MLVTMIDHMGNDLTVVNAARVSFGKKSDIFSDKDKNDFNNWALSLLFLKAIS